MKSRNPRQTTAAGDGRLPTSDTRKPPPAAVGHHGPISRLGDDLLVAILVRLPNARSAFQSKCVCRRWKSLISSPVFDRSFVSHRQQSTNHWDGDGDGDGGELPPLTSYDTRSILSFLPVPREIRPHLIVLDSFKDLVLCGFVEPWNDRNGEIGRLFFVCNPFTKQWIALPLAPKRLVGYHAFNKRLVCEPRNCRSKFNLGDDDGNVAVHPEYRFRVVRVSGSFVRPKVDLFCSESGEWIEDALAGSIQMLGDLMPLYNGKLCWMANRKNVAMWNPFSPDTPPSSIHTFPDCLRDVNWEHFLGEYKVWVSRGALHTVLLKPELDGSVDALGIWRWEEDDRKWGSVYAASLKKLIRGVGFNDKEFKDLEVLDVVGMHPGKGDIVFLECFRSCDTASVVISCNVTLRKLEFFTYRRNWRVLFQPRCTCWPTPIPGYENLRGMYNGRYSCLVQSSSELSTLATITECQPVEGVELFGRDKSTSQPVKKQKVVSGCCSSGNAG